MKVFLDKDEMYPVFDISENWGVECDVPDSLLEDKEYVDRQWHAIQGKLQSIYNEAKKQELLNKCRTEGRPAIGF